MSLPDETQFADDLRRYLAAEQPFSPDVAAIERIARRQHRRAVGVRGLAGAAVLGLAAAGGVAVTAKAPSATVTTAAAPKAPAVKTETVAYVRQQVETALTPANALIENRQTGNNVDDPAQSVTIWTDPLTGNTMLFQGSGQSRVTYWEHDAYENRVLHWHQTQVDWGPRTWWTYDMHAAGPIQGPVPAGPVGGSYTPASQVKEMLAKGNWKITGHPVVDGHRTIELSLSLPGTMTNTIWADEGTYQVVRTVRQVRSLAPITANYTWVPRSAAMTARINHPRIPAGFSQVPPGS